jgi:hypothetical protein
VNCGIHFVPMKYTGWSTCLFKNCHFLFWGPSKSLLFLEMESSYSLWWLNSFISNMNKICQTILMQGTCSFIHTYRSHFKNYFLYSVKIRTCKPLKISRLLFLPSQYFFLYSMYMRKWKMLTVLFCQDQFITCSSTDPPYCQYNFLSLTLSVHMCMHVCVWGN